MKTYELTQNIVVSGVEYDTKHVYPTPYERNDLYLQLIDEQTPASPDAQLQPEMGKLLYADVDFEYNYYSAMYESFTVGVYSESHDYLLPSLNLWLLQKNEVFEDAHLYANMFNRINENNQLLDPTLELSQDFFEFSERTITFYKDIGDYQNIKNDLGSNLPGFGKPEFIDKRSLKVYQDRENKREMFPFFSKFKLAGVDKNSFCNLLEEYELEHNFIDFLVMHGQTSDTEVDYRINTAFGSPTGTDIKVKLYLGSTFLAHLDAGHSGNISSYKEDDDTCSYFESFIRAQVFKVKLAELIKNSSGEPFTTAFKMEKYGDDTEAVSIHYFFNYAEVEQFLYFDTQIAYGKSYEYKIKVINGMVRDGELLFIEEPYYSESVFILDSPPIAPDIEFLTYRGIDNKVLILFNQMIDKKALVPVYINDSDYDTFEEQYRSQNIVEPNPIIFESDDPVDFELFKLTKKPVEYSDFSNNNYTFINSNGMTAASIEDTIVPNQTYYYTFRAQDKHGHISNPTPVYEFILNKEGETLYPKIRIVDFAKPEPPIQKNKTFKKYVKIGLSPRQYQIPPGLVPSIGQDLVNTDIPIGVSDDNLLASNRTFKFRIRSKNTGKLIDINVTFKKNKVIKV